MKAMRTATLTGLLSTALMSTAVMSTALTTTACGTAEEAPAAPGYRQLHANYFSASGGCAQSSCHSGSKGISGLSFSSAEGSYQQLVGVTATNAAAAAAGMARVTANKPEASLLYLKLLESSTTLGAKHFGQSMPIGGEGRAGLATLDAVRRWIEAGAPMEGGDFTADVIDDSAHGTTWVKCSATDAAGLKTCLGAEPDPKKFIRLYTPPITVPAGAEVTVCSYLDYKAPTDLLLRAALAKQMIGGHHAAVFVANSPVADHVPHVCGNEEMGNYRFVAATLGSGGMAPGMPDGIALKIAKGEQVVIQSHYHNTGAKPRVVMDAIDIQLLDSPDPAKVKIADPFAVLASNFTIPKGEGKFTAEKVCKLDRDMSIYMMLGHAHENAVDFTYEHKAAGADAYQLLYKSTDGKALRNSPDVKTFSAGLAWKKGDQVRLRCVWQQTDHAITWPEEMCVALMYYTDGQGFLTCDDADESPKGGGTAKGCVPAGNPGNELGIGKACTAGGSECTDNKQATLCIGIFEPSQNYCTFIGCTKDADCGAGAHCSIDPKGSACQPDLCN